MSKFAGAVTSVVWALVAVAEVAEGVEALKVWKSERR